MPEVIAKEPGFDGLRRRKEGELFDWPDNVPLPRWVSRVGGDDSKASRRSRRGDTDGPQVAPANPATDAANLV